MLNWIKSYITGIKETPVIVNIYAIGASMDTARIIAQDGATISMIPSISLSLLAIGIIADNIQRVLKNNQ